MQIDAGATPAAGQNEDSSPADAALAGAAPADGAPPDAAPVEAAPPVEAPADAAPPAPPSAAELAKAVAEGRLRHLIDQVFDRDSYLWLNADVAAAAQSPNFNPYNHYVDFGRTEGRAPSVFFEIGYVDEYVKRVEQRDVAPRDLMAFYANLPVAERFVPNRWFSAWAFRARYAARFPELNGMADFDVMDFYLRKQRQHALSPSGLFSEAAYRRHYPDIAAQIVLDKVGSGFVHFITKGQAEGRVGIPGYGLALPDRKAPALLNKVLLGQVSNLTPSLWWYDEEFYLSAYRDAHALKRRGAIRSGLEHFLVAGCREGRVPHPLMPPEPGGETEDGWSFVTAMAKRTPPLQRTISFALACQVRDLIESQPGAAERAEITAAIWPFVERPRVSSKLDVERYFCVNPDLGHALKNDQAAARTHWERHGFFEGRKAPGTNFFALGDTAAGPLPELRQGVNFFAPLSSKSGLGNAARGYLAALRAAGVPVAVHDISAMLHGTLPADLFHHEGLPHAVNFFFLNADQVLRFFRKYGVDFLVGRFNIASWVWELPAPLPEWRATLAAFDLIVTPSRFTTESVALLTDTPVIMVPYVVDQPALQDAAAAGGYAQWAQRLAQDKEEGKRIVLFVMDASSYTARKGLDLYEKLATHCQLTEPGRYVFVLKTYARDYSLTDASRASGRHLLVIDGLIEFSELCHLKSLADLYVSPHRSEGFGLNIFESLLLGVPALCSSFAGPIDLLGPDYPYYIPGGLTELGRDMGPYRAEAVWFEPDFDALLERFLAFFEHPAPGAVQPLAAILAETLSPAGVGARLRALLEAHGGYRHDETTVSGGAAKAPGEEIYTFETPDRNGQKLAGLAELVTNNGRPFFSVITPVFNAEPQWLLELYQDLITQTHPFWEWCIADDGSTRTDTIETLRALRKRDARVQVHFGAASAGLPAATNRAVLTASGMYLVMVGQADRISRDLLKTYRTWIGERKTGVLLYCDEDKVDDLGVYGETFFKPDWSPEHLLSCMYMSHCICVRKQLFLELGGYNGQFAGAEDHDFALRVAAAGTPIWHVDERLYHARTTDEAALVTRDPYDDPVEHGRLAVQAHCDRIGVRATVENGELPGTYRPRPALPEDTVCINILTGCTRIESQPSAQTYVERLVRSILEHAPAPEFRLRIIVDFDRAGDIAHLETLSPNVELVPYAWNTGTFNFPEKVNFAVHTDSSERIVMLDDDTLVIESGWLEALLEMLEMPGVGVVGGRLLRPNGLIQHAGIVLGVAGACAHLFVDAPQGEICYNGFPHVIRNYAAVTGAMLAFRRSTFEVAGGFDESFPIDYSDVDFCLKVVESGLRVVYTPFASLIHYESRSAKRLAPDEIDTMRFVRRWNRMIERDPFYNVNLTRSSAYCEPRTR